MNKLGTQTHPDTIRFERLLPGPIERVWRYLTESDKRGEWLATGSMDLRAGGAVDFSFVHANLSEDKIAPEKYRSGPATIGLKGRILKCEPPRLLSYTWGENFDHASEVTFELTPQGDEVLLVVTHRLLDSGEEKISTAAGWHAHLEVLEARLRGTPVPGFWTTHTRMEQEYGQRIKAS